MNYSTGNIWLIILLLGAGTFLIRFSFIGLIGDRTLPPLVLKLLRYTPVAVMPGLIAPLVIWPEATGGTPDPARLLAAATVVIVGVITKNMVIAICCGLAVLYPALYLLG